MRHLAVLTRFQSIILIIFLWLLLKHVLNLPDRYLPHFEDVIQAAIDFRPSILIHTAYTALRLGIGFVTGTITGITIALLLIWLPRLNHIALPLLNSARAIPAAAAIPLFILWFGFSEFGRFLLVITSIGFNITITCLQIVKDISEPHAVFFSSFGHSPSSLLFKYTIQRIIEDLLPTLRFSMVVAIGAVTVSELLGPQAGLGYILSTSRSTYSIAGVLVAASILGMLNILGDFLLTIAWKQLIFWKKIS